MTITAAPWSSAGDERRQRGEDALFGGDLAVLDRHVEVFADQHALAAQVEVGHADDGHGGA